MATESWWVLAIATQQYPLVIFLLSSCCLLVSSCCLLIFFFLSSSSCYPLLVILFSLSSSHPLLIIFLSSSYPLSVVFIYFVMRLSWSYQYPHRHDFRPINSLTATASFHSSYMSSRLPPLTLLTCPLNYYPSSYMSSQLLSPWHCSRYVSEPHGRGRLHPSPPRSIRRNGVPCPCATSSRGAGGCHQR